MTIDRTTPTLVQMNENIPQQAAKQSRPFVTQETKIPTPSGYYRPARVVLKLKGLKYELITLFGKSHTSLMSKLQIVGLKVKGNREVETRIIFHPRCQVSLDTHSPRFLWGTHCTGGSVVVLGLKSLYSLGVV